MILDGRRAPRLLLLSVVGAACVTVLSAQDKTTRSPVNLADLRQDNYPGYQLVKSTISRCVASCLSVDKFSDKCSYESSSGRGYLTVRSVMSTCISQCLDIDGVSEQCLFEGSTGRVIGGMCTGDFMRPPATDKKMVCVYEKKDLDKGLTVEMLVDSNLCSHILVLVMTKYISRTPPGISEVVVVDTDLYKLGTELYEFSGVSLFFKMGTGFNMTDSMNPTDFSRTFSLKGARSRWTTAVANFTSRPEHEHYEGFYLRWLYPGCPLDDCKTGPASDEHTLVDAIKELIDAWKTYSPGKKWDIAMEFSAKQDNIYMGFGVEKLSKMLTYMLLLNYEWAEPKPTKAPKTAFQTPLARNNETMALLTGTKKYKPADHRTYFYGVTATLIYYVLDVERNKKLPEGTDEFMISGKDSRFIPYSEACNRTLTKEHNYQFFHPTSTSKTSYAKNESSFIPYDDAQQVMDKVGYIFSNYKIGGAWMKDISNDDFEGKICGCGPFPALRATNEGLFGSSCKMKKCFQQS